MSDDDLNKLIWSRFPELSGKDLCGDLNAMAVAEEYCIGSGLAGGNADVVYHKALELRSRTRPIWNASARLRAEAFAETYHLNIL